MEGGFYAIALLGFVGQLVMFIIGPSVGKLLDQAPRDKGLAVVLTLQNLTVAIGALCILYAFVAQPGVAIQSTRLFPLLLVASIIERVANGISDVAMERDWVVTLSGGQAGMLARCNAMLRRIDLGAELLATFLFGLACTIVG